jgi:hypothetical protein
MSGDTFIFKGDIKLLPNPKYVGGYRIGGDAYYTQFMLVRKPIWLHRVMARLLLGWKWIDSGGKV